MVRHLQGVEGMTFGRTRSVTLEGLAGSVVEVEAHLSGGLPAFMLGGLPDTACAQSPNRVKAAAASIGHSLAQTGSRSTCRPRRSPRTAADSTCPSPSPWSTALGLIPPERVR